MRFLLDENVDLPLADYLNEQGHDATAVALDYSRSIKDDEVWRSLRLRAESSSQTTRISGS